MAPCVPRSKPSGHAMAKLSIEDSRVHFVFYAAPSVLYSILEDDMGLHSVH